MVWFDQAAAAQNQGTQQGMLMSAIQAGQAQNALKEGQAQAAAAIGKGIGALQEGQTQGIGALQAGQTGALGGLENYYGQGVGFQQPYMTAGGGAVNQLAALFAPGGDYWKQPTLDQLQMDPGYAFRLQQGQQAMTNAARAGGLAGSGGALKAATRYGQEAGSQEYQNAYKRFMDTYQGAVQGLQGLAGLGANAANVSSGLAGQTGANIGNVYTGTAGNAANLYGQTGANIANLQSNLANIYGQTGQQLAANYNALGQNVGQGLVNQGAANASSYTNSANLLASLLGQGAQAAAYMYGRKPA